MLHTGPVFRALPRLVSKPKRRWWAHTAQEGALVWANLAREAERKAKARRVHEAKLSTRLHRMVRAMARVVGL